MQDQVLLSLTESDGLVLHLAPLRILYSPEWLGDFLDWLLPLLAGGAVTPQMPSVNGVPIDAMTRLQSLLYDSPEVTPISNASPFKMMIHADSLYCFSPMMNRDRAKPLIKRIELIAVLDGAKIGMDFSKGFALDWDVQRLSAALAAEKHAKMHQYPILAQTPCIGSVVVPTFTEYTTETAAVYVGVKTPALNIDMSSEGFHVLLNLSCLNMAPISRHPPPRPSTQSSFASTSSAPWALLTKFAWQKSVQVDVDCQELSVTLLKGGIGEADPRHFLCKLAITDAIVTYGLRASDMWVDVDFRMLYADAPLAIDHLCREPPPPLSAPGAAWPPPPVSAPSTPAAAGGSAAAWWDAWVSRMLRVGVEQQRSRVYLTIGDKAIKLGQPSEGAPATTPSVGARHLSRLGLGCTRFWPCEVPDVGLIYCVH